MLKKIIKMSTEQPTQEVHSIEIAKETEEWETPVEDLAPHEDVQHTLTDESACYFMNLSGIKRNLNGTRAFSQPKLKSGQALLSKIGTK